MEGTALLVKKELWQLAQPQITCFILFLLYLRQAFGSLFGFWLLFGKLVDIDVQNVAEGFEFNGNIRTTCRINKRPLTITMSKIIESKSINNFIRAHSKKGFRFFNGLKALEANFVKLAQ